MKNTEAKKIKFWVTFYEDDNAIVTKTIPIVSASIEGAIKFFKRTYYRTPVMVKSESYHIYGS